MFLTFRLLFGCVVFAFCFVQIKKSHITHKCKVSIIAFTVIVLLVTISALIPIENSFITFSSPKAVYNYKGCGTVKLVIDGESTALVIGEKGDTSVYTIVPKANNGWKIGMEIDTKRIVQIVSKGVTIYVYQYKNTNDYYITILDTNGGTLKITDNLGSEFHYLDKRNIALNKSFYTYYAYLSGFDEQYILTINGKEIRVRH